MNIKFSEFIRIREVLTKLMPQNFPIKISYPIAKFMRDTDADFNFYSENFNKIIAKYRDEKNIDNSAATIKIREDSVNDFNKEMVELDNQEIEVPALLVDFSSVPDLKITIEDMYWLSIVIK